MGFREKYTTEDLKKKDPIKEADKTVLSTDALAIGELLESVVINLRLR
jgi:hypothetical protein